MRGVRNVLKALPRRVPRVGWLPLLIVAVGAIAAEAAPFAYVPNASSMTGGVVSVIDTATKSVVDEVPVGVAPFRVAISPDGAFAYVANEASNNVSVIDTSINTVVDTVPVGAHPRGLAVTPDGAYVYVPNNASNPATVSVIDTATNTVVATILVGSFPQYAPFYVAITPDGTRAYLTNFSDGHVSWIDTATNTWVADVPGSLASGGMAFTPDGALLYVAGDGAPSFVQVIDTDPLSPTYNTVVATVPFAAGGHIRQVAITPDGTRAYVTNGDANVVNVIDTSTNMVVDTIPVGPNPWGVAITPDGAFAYVANWKLGQPPVTISVIETVTNTVVATVTIDSNHCCALGLAITPF